MTVRTNKLNFLYQGKHIEAVFSGRDGKFDHCDYMVYAGTKIDVPEYVFEAVSNIYSDFINHAITKAEVSND